MENRKGHSRLGRCVNRGVATSLHVTCSSNRCTPKGEPEQARPAGGLYLHSVYFFSAGSEVPGQGQKPGSEQ